MPLSRVRRGAAATGFAATDAAAQLIGWLPVRDALKRDLEAVYDRAAALARMARADHTRRAYKTAWGQYEAWCHGVGIAPLAGDPGTVALYLATLSLKARPATLQARLAAISVAHRLAGVPLDTRHEALRLVLKGARRERGVAPGRQAKAFSAEDLVMLGPLYGDSPREQRDKALLLVGFAAALRRAELAALARDDVAIDHHGALQLTVRRAKGDPEGAGVRLTVSPHPVAAACPVAALVAWLSVRGDAPGPLFWRADRGGGVRARAIGAQAVNGVVKDAARRLGYDPVLYSGHSLRAGLASAAADAGCDLKAIMTQTRLKSPAQAATYMRGRHAGRLTETVFAAAVQHQDQAPGQPQ
ncbi:tyrosine-type recombinase/integrase [Gimibacter soli]|uniref:Tyrosine-type recombinase/integrase n=1 Tax=Gimibacter soli TaxID=3024400 RepID=A0AAE9XMQ2_9PROT|nr:tyrosine-type recombinase/integrase [Gimibacter soli]WCL52882.1 tyrosine-type recombinase/integrase [Gimibacter soli]